MFYVFTIPTILCVIALYIKSKVALASRVNRQLARRGNQLRQAFGIIAAVYTACMVPYVIATPVEQYFDELHNSANDHFADLAYICKFSQNQT